MTEEIRGKAPNTVISQFAPPFGGLQPVGPNRLASSNARMTARTNSGCRCVLVFSKTDLRRPRSVSYLQPNTFVQDFRVSPVIRRITRRASAGVKLNLSLRNAV